MHRIRIVCLTNKCINLKQKVNVLKTHYYKYTIPNTMMAKSYCGDDVFRVMYRVRQKTNLSIQTIYILTHSETYNAVDMVCSGLRVEFHKKVILHIALNISFAWEGTVVAVSCCEEEN